MIALQGAQRDILHPEGHEIQAGSLLLSTLAINILSLSLPLMTLQVYDRVLPNPGSGTLTVLVAGVILAVTLEAALRLTRAYVLGWSGAAFEHRLSCNLMTHILHADLSKMEQTGMGEYLHRVAAIGKLKDFYNGYSLIVISELIFVPLFLLLILYISGPLAIVPVAILMLFTVVSLAQGHKVRKILKDREESDDKRYNFLIEALEGIHTIKAFALENIFSRRYEFFEEESSLANYHLSKSISSIFNVGTIFAHIMVISVIVAGAVYVLNDYMTTGALIATILLSGRIMQPVQRALVLWAKYQDYALSRNKIEQISYLPSDIPLVYSHKNHKRDGRLCLREVSFDKGTEQLPIFKNIHLDVAPGESILLDSRDGTSRTALLDLIAGIYPVTAGEIMVDDKNIRHYSPEERIRRVGYIQKEGIIFRGTIRDNITCFGQIDEAQARDMAALIRVDTAITKLPLGFDTPLSGSQEDALPPGLKQRIAMVRSLALKPRLILFNNADKSLDREGYNIVYSLLSRIKKQATLLIVSDDENIRSLTDRHILLENQTIIEATKKNGVFSPPSYKELDI